MTRGDEVRGVEHDPLVLVPTRADLERAITSVAGVATAAVQVGDGGRDRLHISLSGGADPEVVAWAVAATLRERFGIALDPAAIRAHAAPAPERAPAASDDTAEVPAEDAATTGAATAPDVARSHDTATAATDGEPTHEDFRGDPGLVAAARAAFGLPAPPVADQVEDDRPRPTPRRGAADAAAGVDAAPSEPTTDDHAQADAAGAAVADLAGAPARRRRAAIRELVAQPEGDTLGVQATLRLADREATGLAHGLDTRRGRWRTIAQATLLALSELTGGRLRVDVDHVTVLAFPDLAHVTVSVTLLGEQGEERYLGAAMVRDDPDRAVMRAALDAVNRRVEPWLADPPDAVGRRGA